MSPANLSHLWILVTYPRFIARAERAHCPAKGTVKLGDGGGINVDLAETGEEQKALGEYAILADLMREIIAHGQSG